MCVWCVVCDGRGLGCYCVMCGDVVVLMLWCVCVVGCVCVCDGNCVLSVCVWWLGVK